jgi:hypothetical protein
MRRLLALGLLVALACIAGAGVAHAAAKRPPRLTIPRAKQEAENFGAREAHRIWGVRDTTVEAKECWRLGRALIQCGVVASIHYGGLGSEPVREEAEVSVGLTKALLCRVCTMKVWRPRMHIDGRWELLGPGEGLSPEEEKEKEEEEKEKEKEEEAALKETEKEAGGI